MVRDVKILLTYSLAPYKIVLLALIAAHCSGILPKQTHRPLLSTIVRYIEGPSENNTDESASLPTLDDIIADIKGACLKSDTQNGETYAKDIEIRVLHALWTLKSLDSLHTFITRANSLLVDNLRQGRTMIENFDRSSRPAYLLTKKSFLGGFVLHCIGSFHTLEFDKTDLLFRSFVNFRDTSKSKWMEIGRTHGVPNYDVFGSTRMDDDPSVLRSLISSMDITSSDSRKNIMLVSQHDLSRLVECQVHFLETYGTPTSPKLRDVLKRMAQAETGKIPTTIYVQYLEYLRDADYEGAFKALHRYFDYMMSNRQTAFYHYALLCLASLHAAFDCEEEALRAIDEAISVARENKDVSCLNFLLAWVFNFLKERPHLEHEFYVSNHQLLQYLKTKCADNPSLHAAAYQSDVLQAMLDGSTLTHSFESATKGLYLALGTSNKLPVFISHCSIVSSLWYRTGNFHLSEVYNEVGLQACRSDYLKTGLIIRKAYLECARGNVLAGLKLLDEQRNCITGDLRSLKDITAHSMILYTQEHMKRSCFDEAEIYLNKLKAQEIGNVDIKGALDSLSAELDIEYGNTDAAFDTVNHNLTNLAKKETNQYWFLEFTLLNAKMFGEGSCPARALSMTIHCLSMASSLGLSILVLKSVLQLSDILIKLDQVDDASSLIYSSLKKFEQVGDLELRTKAYHILSRAIAKSILSSDHELVPVFLRCLEVSIDGYKKLSLLKGINDCFLLQIDVGTLIRDTRLVAHAESALEKLKVKKHGNGL